ncbi:MAG: enoyl-CoA hydratase/isomerase family protein [Desulfomonilaceae bacterium]
MLNLRKENSVYVLTMNNDDKPNTLTPESLNEFHSILDEVEATRENAALLLTSDHPTVWNTGLDLEWLSTQGGWYHEEFATALERFFLRWALLNLPTIGCITGHAYGGGAMLAVTLDFRFMREDRGWFRFPAIDMNITFTPIMHQILELLPNSKALRYLLLAGKQFGGEEAATLDIVDHAYSQSVLSEKAMEVAHTLATKDRKTYTTIKLGMRHALVALRAQLEGRLA